MDWASARPMVESSRGATPAATQRSLIRRANADQRLRKAGSGFVVPTLLTLISARLVNREPTLIRQAGNIHTAGAADTRERLLGSSSRRSPGVKTPLLWSNEASHDPRAKIPVCHHCDVTA